MNDHSTPDPCRKSFRGAPSFSLVELLVVVAIMAMLLVVSLPSFQTITMGSNLSRGGQMVGDLIAQAHQEAVAKNREVRVCFYHFSTGQTPGWRAMQVFRIDPSSTSSTTTNAVTRLLTLPDGVIIAGSNPPQSDDTLSPLLNADLTSTDVPNVRLPGVGTSDGAVGFRFKASGSAYVSFDSQHNFLTLQNIHDAKNSQNSGVTPANYYAVQIDPVVGKITIYRP